MSTLFALFGLVFWCLPGKGRHGLAAESEKVTLTNVKFVGGTSTSFSVPGVLLDVILSGVEGQSPIYGNLTLSNNL
jgi:hypothetical protein